jgi:hypothetical protein
VVAILGEFRLICAKCGEPKAHRSHTSGLKDWAYKKFQLIPYRCRACKARFYAYRSGEQSSTMRTGEERKIMELRRRIKWKRTKKELVIYAVGAALMISFLYLVMQQRVE